MQAKIRNVALGLLARREHSQFELGQKLKAKGFTADEIAEVLAKLASQGLQSDQRFAESYISMRAKRGFGPVRIKNEMRERGVSQEISEKYLDEFGPAWLDSLVATYRKKFGKKIPVTLKEQAKQKNYLYNKGFAADAIGKIFKFKDLEVLE